MFINRKPYVFNFQFLAGVVCKTYADIDAWYTIKKEYMYVTVFLRAYDQPTEK